MISSKHKFNSAVRYILIGDKIISIHPSINSANKSHELHWCLKSGRRKETNQPPKKHPKPLYSKFLTVRHFKQSVFITLVSTYLKQWNKVTLSINLSLRFCCFYLQDICKVIINDQALTRFSKIIEHFIAYIQSKVYTAADTCSSRWPLSVLFFLAAKSIMPGNGSFITCPGQSSTACFNTPCSCVWLHSEARTAGLLPAVLVSGHGT